MSSYVCHEAWNEEVRLWLPDDEQRYYGHIDYNPKRGPSVHVIDSPLGRQGIPTANEPPAAVPLMLGETLGRKPFTLFDGWVVSWQQFGFASANSGNTADVLFQTLIFGGHFENLDEVRTQAAGVKLQGLLEFVTGGSVDIGLLGVAAFSEELKELEAELPGCRLVLRASSQRGGGRLEQRTTVRANAFFEFDTDRGLGAIDSAVQTLKDLVVFGTREPSWIQSLHLQRGEGEERGSLEVVRAPVIEPTEARHSGAYYALMFNPAQAEEKPTREGAAELIREWYELRLRLGPVWPLYFATLQRQDLPLENQLLNLSAFAEGYHRTEHDEVPLPPEEADEHVKAMLTVLPGKRERDVFESALAYANSQTQRQRMRWLARRAVETIEWDLDVKQFCAELADTRNWLTHWGDRGPNVREGEGLYRLIRRLDLVLTVNLQLDVGLDATDVAQQVGSGLRLGGLP